MQQGYLSLTPPDRVNMRFYDKLSLHLFIDVNGLMDGVGSRRGH